MQAVLAFLLMTLFVALSPATASAASLGPYVIQQQGNLKCLEVPGAGSTATNLPLVTQNCFGNRQQWQQWFFVEVGAGYYQIKNVKTLQCMTRFWPNEVRTDVAQNTCTSSTSNQWMPINKITDGVDFYRLQNRATGLCLHTVGPAGAGTAVNQISCGSAYRWTWRA